MRALRNADDEPLQITFWELLQKIQFEALMWGIGTAIGELPPYFVARAGITTLKMPHCSGDLIHIVVSQRVSLASH